MSSPKSSEAIRDEALKILKTVSPDTQIATVFHLSYLISELAGRLIETEERLNNLIASQANQSSK